MGANDKYLRKKAQQSWEDHPDQRNEDRKDLREPSQRRQKPPEGDTWRTDEQKEINRLKSEISDLKKQVKHWKGCYKTARGHWFNSCRERWTRRSLDVPLQVETELERIKNEWADIKSDAEAITIDES